MADFTAREQLMLELINRARMDPVGEAKRFGIDLNEGVPTGATISASPKQVLAGSDQLGLSADQHSQWMRANNVLDHNEAPGTTGFYDKSPFDRMEKAGYVFYTAGENIAYVAGSSIDVTRSISDMHRNFFVDGNVAGRGHRTNILAESYKEVGVGHDAGPFKGTTGSLVTEDFGQRGTAAFITGVVYGDTVKNDNFFTVGEETAGLDVAGSGSTDTTGAGGGYELEYASKGNKIISFDLAGDNDLTVKVKLGSLNVKVDAVNGNEIWTNAASLTSQSTAIKGLYALGVSRVDLNGSSANEKLTGNAAANKLDGNAGNDKLSGLGGDDRLIGGAGHDTMSGGAGDDVFRFETAADSTKDLPDLIKDFGDSGIDRLDLSKLFSGTLTYRDEAAINGAHQVNVTRHGQDVIVHINLDADAADEMQIVLSHTSLEAMTKEDFIL